MIPHDEKQFLEGLQKHLNVPPQPYKRNLLRSAIVWILTALFVMVLAQIAQGYPASPIVLALGSLTVGIVVSWLTFSETGARQWSVLRAHINHESVRARLTELEA